MDQSWMIETRNSGIKKAAGFHRRRPTLFALLFVIMLACSLGLATPAQAQAVTPTPSSDDTLQAPERVDIEPTARDEEIRARLMGILEATGWFLNPDVEVDEGVVFLRGMTRDEEYKIWAGDLARNTQDVAAVVNQIQLTQPSIWDFQPAVNALREMWRNLLRAVPALGFSLIILLLTWVAARFTIRAARASILRRFSNQLLSNVIARGLGILIFLVGVYIIFHVAGLTSVALTVLGGTGLLGLILGIAFQDITENFLASILLSVQNPFHTGDLVEIAGIKGFVQALTTRATILMSLDGNHVQIPNATVYKSNIYNFTSNPNSRADFMIGIGYEDSITAAQEIALKVLEEHPAVLKDPEPWVLVESLGSATVMLHIYYWVDAKEHSILKVKSSVIRLVKGAFQLSGISMPDEAREMIFPKGVPVRMIDPKGEKTINAGKPQPEKPGKESQQISTQAEGGLRSEAEEIQEQARHARHPEEGPNLLKPDESE